MDSEPRNWKWMLPGFLIPVVLTMAAWLYQVPHPYLRMLWVTFFAAAGILAVAMLGNFMRYVSYWWVNHADMRRRSVNETTDVLLLREARGIHPNTLQILMNDRRRARRLISGTLSPDEQPYDVLHADQGITVRFVAYVLYMSSEKKVMSKHQLVEGRKKLFDPSGEVPEYEMYDRLMALWIRELRITRPAANDTSYWLNEWTPEAVALDLGMEWDVLERTATELIHRASSRAGVPFVFEDLNEKENAR